MKIKGKLFKKQKIKDQRHEGMSNGTKLNGEGKQKDEQRDWVWH